MEHGLLGSCCLFVKGPGSGRETAIRSLQAAGLVVSGIQDKTPIALAAAVLKRRHLSTGTSKWQLLGPRSLKDVVSAGISPL